MRDAALRGVRVRLLIDDFYTTGHDEFFLAFAAFPNVEVRLFNPFIEQRDAGKATRFVSAVGDGNASTTACTTSCSLPTVRWQ